jgi:hypothetical protein
MWQVFRKTTDGYEAWDVPLFGEVFSTQEQAEARADELDRVCCFLGDFHIVKEVEV